MKDDLYYHGMIGGGDSGLDVSYLRPAQWLALPALNDTLQKFVGLFAVREAFPYIALSATSDYTVDWGDGTVENFASGVTAYHVYNFTNTALNGTLTDEGYKQAVISLTPQSGKTFTSLNLNIIPIAGVPAGGNSGWLDIEVAGEFLTSLTLGVASANSRLSELQRVAVHKNAVTSWNNMFNSCFALRQVAKLYTSAGTGFASAFQGCYALRAVPLFDTSQALTLNSMFTSCSSLTNVPAFNTSKCTNFDSLFSYCSALLNVPYFDTSAGTSFSATFAGCAKLTSVPLINTANGTYFYNFLSSCSSLLTAPFFDLGKATDCNNMFYGCSRLLAIPAYNTGQCLNFSSMFSGCRLLADVPLLNTSKGTNFSTMFNGCSVLRKMPAFDTSNGTNFSGMFSSCVGLISVPAFNTTRATDMGNMYGGCVSLTELSPHIASILSSASSSTVISGCYSVKKFELIGAKINALSVASTRLGVSELEKLMSGLGLWAGTLTITSTPGAASSAAVSLTGGTTAGSNVVTMASTAGLAVGMGVSGSGLATVTDRAVLLDAVNNTVTQTAHGYSGNTPLIFSTTPSKVTVGANMPSNGAWTYVVEGNGVILAVKTNFNAAATSSDGGVTWTARTIPVATGIRLAFGNGVFVLMLSGSGTTYYTSTDGVNWTSRTLPITMACAGVIYTNNSFVAINSLSAGKTLVSANALTWTQTQATGSTAGERIMLAGNGLIVAIDKGVNTATFYYSNDGGSTWKSSIFPSTSTYIGVFGNGQFLIVETSSSTKAYVSTDAVNFATAPYPTSAAAASVASLTFGNGLFYAARSTVTTAGFFVSSDALTWSDVPDSTLTMWSTAIFTSAGAGLFLSGGANLSSARVWAAVLPKLGSVTYYPVQITTDSFKLASSIGGTALDIDGTQTALAANMRAAAVIDSIVANTSITLSAPAATTVASTTLSFRTLKVIHALMRGWTVTG